MTMLKRDSFKDTSVQVTKKQKTSKPITDFFRKSSKPSVSKSKEIETVSKETETTAILRGDEQLNEIEHNSGLSQFKQKFKNSLTEEQKELLDLEITTIEESWFEALHKEFLKPYFLELKRFLRSEKKNKAQIFPPELDIYSWSNLTPLSKVKVIVLGQDPYHDFNQAHGLAFSVKKTVPPPSLKNMYKALKIDYPDFEIPKSTGDLTKWAEQGVLLLNACLTVKAHNANSHSKKGWEQFTEKVIEVVLKNALSNKNNLVLFLWGSAAQKRVENLNLKLDKNFLVLKSVHPSPLSASRGYFDGHHYKKCNDWLISKGEEPVDWCLVKGNVVAYK